MSLERLRAITSLIWLLYCPIRTFVKFKSNISLFQLQRYGEQSSITAVKLTERQSGVLFLITGEIGTGKELAAKVIQRHRSRHKKPFICINCAALPESLVESKIFGYQGGAFTGAYSAYAGKLKTRRWSSSKVFALLSHRKNS